VAPERSSAALNQISRLAQQPTGRCIAEPELFGRLRVNPALEPPKWMAPPAIQIDGPGLSPIRGRSLSP
jgi:hypothetical protein